MDVESAMRQAIERTSSRDSVDPVALDWESLGRLVRRHSLEAVAMHFAAIGGVLSCAAGKHVEIPYADPDCPGEGTRTSARA
jgi:hypothetical protein